jgi:hypothetical protein
VGLHSLPGGQQLDSVVEGRHDAIDLLAGLVSLSGHENHVTASRPSHARLDRGPPVTDDHDFCPLVWRHTLSAFENRLPDVIG